MRSFLAKSKNLTLVKQKSKIMKPLESIQLAMTWLYAFPTDPTASKWKKLAYFMFSLGITVANLSSTTAGALFIVKNVSNNLEDSIFAFFHTIACFNMLYQSIVIVVLRRKLAALFTSLSKIYEESKKEKYWHFLLTLFILVYIFRLKTL